MHGVSGQSGNDGLMIIAREHVLSDWLCDEPQSEMALRGSKCTNDCEQSGHSNHEYWIRMGARLHHATPIPFLLLVELNLPTERRGHTSSRGRCEEGETVETVTVSKR